MHASLSPLFLGQLKNLHKAIVADFQTSLTKELKGDSYDFAEVVQRLKKEAFKRFEMEGAALLLTESDWSITEPLAQMSDDLSAVADRARAEETKKMVLAIEVSWHRTSTKRKTGYPAKV